MEPESLMVARTQEVNLLSFEAAQRVLAIQEIVYIICEHLWLDHWQSALYNLALTCKIFCDPALCFLWWEIPDLATLLRVMPSDLWEESLDDDCMTSLRPILQTDWDRFDRYSVLVREYNYFNAQEIVDATVFQALSAHPRSQALLPNLRKLGWYHVPRDIYPFISLFLGPRLGCITMDFGFNNNSLNTLTMMATRCPDIRIVTFKNHRNNSDVLAFDALCRWPSLHSLEIGSISTTLFMHLWGSSTLQTLNVGSLNYLQWDVVDAQLSDRDGFQQLQELFVSDTKADTCARVLEVSSLSLRAFAFWPGSDIKPSEWEHLLTALHDRCDHQSLKFLILFDHINATHPTGSVDLSMTEKHITPLFAFRALVTVSISPASDIVLTDDGIKRMAMSWPNIVSLTLAPSNLIPSETEVTLLSLRYLANFCPRLAELGLRFDSRITSLDGTEQTSVATGCSLHTLRVGNSPIANPAEVAAELSRLFPNLSTIRGFTPIHEVSVEFPEVVITFRANAEWEEVEQLLNSR